MRRFGEFCAELLDEPRLADAGLANDLDELTLAFERARPAPHQQRKFVLAADEWRQGARPAAPASAARPNYAIECDRRRHALEVMRALVLDDEKPGRLPLDARGDEHCPRLGRCLHPRRDIRRFAEHFAGRVDHDGAALDADAGGKLNQERELRAIADRKAQASQALDLLLKQIGQTDSHELQALAEAPASIRRAVEGRSTATVRHDHGVVRGPAGPQPPRPYRLPL